jgi:hypothetical protein
MVTAAAPAPNPPPPEEPKFTDKVTAELFHLKFLQSQGDQAKQDQAIEADANKDAVTALQDGSAQVDQAVKDYEAGYQGLASGLVNTFNEAEGQKKAASAGMKGQAQKFDQFLHAPDVSYDVWFAYYAPDVADLLTKLDLTGTAYDTASRAYDQAKRRYYLLRGYLKLAQGKLKAMGDYRDKLNQQMGKHNYASGYAYIYLVEATAADVNYGFPPPGAAPAPAPAGAGAAYPHPAQQQQQQQQQQHQQQQQGGKGAAPQNPPPPTTDEFRAALTAAASVVATTREKLRLAKVDYEKAKARANGVAAALDALRKDRETYVLKEAAYLDAIRNKPQPAGAGAVAAPAGAP